MDSLRRPVPGGRRLAGHAGQGQPLGRGHRGVQAARRVLPRLDRRRRRPGWPRTASPRSRCSSTPSSAWRRSGRSRSRLPGVHRRRRQGQRLLRRPVRAGAADRGAPVTGTRIEHDSMGEVEVPAERALGGADPAGGGQLPGIRGADRARPDRRARLHQGRGGPGQRRTGRARRRHGRRDRRRGRRGGPGRARRRSSRSTCSRPVPAPRAT